MEEKKNSSGLAVLTIVLAVALIVLTGFVTYYKLSEKPTNNNDEAGTTVEKITVVTEAKVKKAYYDLIKYGNEKEPHLTQVGDGVGYDYFLSFLTDKKLVITKDITYNTRMQIAYEKLYRDKKVTVTENPTKDPNEYAGATTKFLVSDIKEAYQYYFGPLDSIDTFEVDAGTCNVDGEYCICNRSYPLDGLAGPIYVFSKYSKYESADNIVYVYEKVLYCIDERNDNGTIRYYSDSKHDNEITELKGVDPNKLLDTKYDDKMLTYKYGFKQNSDGSLYLYSVEPVK